MAWARSAFVVEFVFYVVPSTLGWRVLSRGFTWEFKDRQGALAFAMRSAKDYADGTGHSTSVRLQRGDGSFRELSRFAGITRLPTSGFAVSRPSGRGHHR